MSESRVERLLRLAEEAVIKGEFEAAYNFVNIADTALEVRKQEAEEIQKMLTPSGSEADGLR